MSELHKIAQQMVTNGKGVLAIDESTGTCEQRFKGIDTKCTEEKRREYRGLLVTAPQLEEAISGMILFDETLRQATDDGTLFPQALAAKGILPGIKVDTGAKDLALHEGEKVTEGLDGLRERLAEYKTLGAKFAKWRAVIKITDELPSPACIEANAHALARYAALCQEAGIVPMVEPEILYEGDHDIETCADISAAVWDVLFEQLEIQEVDLQGLILKTSFILNGKDSHVKNTAAEVAKYTAEIFQEVIPEELAGIVFLSGGLSAEEATAFLNEINKTYTNLPWPISFSYGRGIQADALQAWAGSSENIAKAQELLLGRARENGKAAQGEF